MKYSNMCVSKHHATAQRKKWTLENNPLAGDLKNIIENWEQADVLAKGKRRILLLSTAGGAARFKRSLHAQPWRPSTELAPPSTC